LAVIDRWAGRPGFPDGARMHASIIRYFVAVARTTSIRKAAEQLHVANSAVARQIKLLEEELGVELFERLPSGLRLTPFGEVVLAHFTETIESYEGVKSTINEMRGQRVGTVRVCSLDSWVATFMPGQVQAFHTKYPLVNFHVRGAVHSAVVQQVNSGEVDFGITFNLPYPKTLSFVHPVDMPLVAAMSADHPLAGRAQVTLAECAQHPLILQLETEPVRALIEREVPCDRNGVRILCISNNITMHKKLVSAGLGISFLTPLALADEVNAGSIVTVPIDGPDFARMKLGFFVLKNRTLPVVADLMMQDLASHIAEVAQNLAIGSDRRDPAAGS